MAAILVFFFLFLWDSLSFSANSPSTFLVSIINNTTGAAVVGAKSVAADDRFPFGSGWTPPLPQRFDMTGQANVQVKTLIDECVCARPVPREGVAATPEFRSATRVVIIIIKRSTAERRVAMATFFFLMFLFYYFYFPMGTKKK